MRSIDFPLILTSLVVLTGLITFIDAVLCRARRGTVYRQTHVILWIRSIFPVLLLVWIIRSFIVQPYHVPTGSLEPTIYPGDFMLVNQFAYGLHFPVFHKKFLSVGDPKRGDIVLFHWPPHPHMIYVKRMIGLPGDHIRYHDKVLFINGKKMAQSFVKQTQDREPGETPVPVYQFKERLGSIEHAILLRPYYDASGNFDLSVPKDHYFVMGDNRDNSGDSREWGFVPKSHLIGKALIVLVSWDANRHRLRWRHMGRLIH